MAGDGGPLEPELVEQRDQILRVVLVAVRRPVRAEAVAPEIDRDDPQAAEQRRDAQPVARVAGEPVKQDDRRPRSDVGVGELLRAPILRGRQALTTRLAPT